MQSRATEFFDVHNPAVGDIIGRTPLSTAADVDAAVAGGDARVSRLARHAGQRARAGALQVQGAPRAALRGARAHGHDRARQDARRSARQRAPRHRVRRGGVRRAVADAGLRPRGHLARASTATSSASRSASCAAIAPFNFPAMVPMWFLPFAIVTGNTFVLKPSEQVPLSQRMMVDLLQQCDLPPGVVNLVNGGTRRRQRDLRSSRHPRGVVRRLDAGRAARLSARDARRQARAGARRREELRRRHAGRRPRAVDRRRSPNRSTGARASAASRAACWCRSATCTARRAIGWSRRRKALKVGDGLRAGRDDGAGDQRDAPRPGRRLHRQGRRGRREAARRRPSDARPGSAERLFRRPDGLRRCVAEDGDRPRRDLRAGRVDLPRASRSTRRSR